MSIDCLINSSPSDICDFPIAVSRFFVITCNYYKYPCNRRERLAAERRTRGALFAFEDGLNLFASSVINHVISVFSALLFSFHRYEGKVVNRLIRNIFLVMKR